MLNPPSTLYVPGKRKLGIITQLVKGGIQHVSTHLISVDYPSIRNMVCQESAFTYLIW